VSNVVIRSEPLTYREGGAYSFFSDMIEAQGGDAAALRRLQRHRTEMEVERRDVALPDGVEARVNPNSTAGTGGEFDVPLWLMDRFADSVSAHRPLGDLCNPLPLPDGVQSIHIPRITTGAILAPQSDGGAVASQDIVTTDASSNVVTIAGMMDVSQQLMDRSPAGFDAYAYVELMGDYATALETQLISGTGTGNQLRGVLNVSGTTSIDGSSASTAILFFAAVGKAAAGVGNARFLPPQVWLMAPRRWFWLSSLSDSQSRPVFVPTNGPVPAGYRSAGDADPVGPLLGLPVYLDGAIPAGSTADTVVCVRPSDMLLFESTPRFMVTPQPLSGTLQARLSIHKYVAFVPHRYPSAIGKVTALAAPSGF